MKKQLITLAIIAIAFAAGFAFSQATVSLWPDVQVSAEQRANAVWGVCYQTGYAGEWDNNAAMWQHYRRSLVEYVRDCYRQSKHDESVASIVEQDLGVTP